MTMDFWAIIGVFVAGQIATTAFIIGAMGAKIDGLASKAKSTDEKIENHIDWHLSGERRHNLKM